MSGVVVAALDFRLPPVAAYPASLADFNYAIRWLKTRATDLHSRPDLVGVLGVSSGAHQAMLGGMRPHDPRYAAIPLPAGAPSVDASVRCVVLCWPVIDPLARYHYARKLKAGGTSSMYTVFGFDRLSRALLGPDCTPAEWQAGKDLVHMIEDAGIHFFASFGVGSDDQDKGVFDRIIQFSHEAGIDLAEFYIETPFPGTPFGLRLEAENRILHRNYDLWNTGNVVYKPKNLTEDELLEGFLGLWGDFYDGKNEQRTLRTFEGVSQRPY
jgi:hypothetical protein